MSHNIQPITLYTVPSQKTAAFCAPYDKPYRRVVGMTTDDDREILWVPRTKEPYEYEGPAEVLELELPPLFVGRLVRFMKDYLMFERPRNNYNPVFFDRYNCHSFGRAITQGTVEGPSLDGKNARALLEHAPRIEPPHLVAPGRLALIGYVNQQARLEAGHSLIGLGDEQCMQVIANDGNLGVAPIEQVLDEYSLRYDHRKYHGLYLPAVPTNETG